MEMAEGRKKWLAGLHTQGGVQGERMRCIAHDLASPLTPMRLQLAAWKQNGVKLPGLRVLERSIDRMERLVQDLADLAWREGEGLRIDAEPTDLQEVIEDVTASFRLHASVHQITLSRRSGADLVAKADPHRIAQVLDNLVRNAIKFTPQGGAVTVEGHRMGDGIQIAVSDTGRGMDQHERSRLFRPYSQLRRADSENGTGLGLFICKNIVQAHGGRLWVESDGHGKGSRFVAEIPVSGAVSSGRMPSSGNPDGRS